MRVLVTGGSGFIGSHVVDKLRARGHEPVIYDLRPSPWHTDPAHPVDTVLGSITDREALERALHSCDAVAHLAAVADVNDVHAEPEAYSFDEVSQLGFIAARTQRLQIASGILQLYSRTPALTAMTAAGLDYVSGGRFVLGIGASGPQVIEGWHGVPYDSPVGRTREVIEICRKVWRRERLEYAGQHYPTPRPPDQGTGLGKPLKLINHPVRERIPIVVAALGPKNVELAAELAEGWEPIFYFPEKAAEAWSGPLASGRAKRDPSLGPLDVEDRLPLAIGEDTGGLLDFGRPIFALYIGGMGAKGRNFYNDLAVRFGRSEERRVGEEGRSRGSSYH